MNKKQGVKSWSKPVKIKLLPIKEQEKHSNITIQIE